MKITNLKSDGSAFIWAITLLIILTIGEPDLLEAIIKYILSLSGGGK